MLSFRKEPAAGLEPAKDYSILDYKSRPLPIQGTLAFKSYPGSVTVLAGEGLSRDCKILKSE